MKSKSLQQRPPNGIVRSYVARNGVILAEATQSDGFDLFINQAMSHLHAKKPTPGWEFSSLPLKSRPSCKTKLQGMKFHIYEDPNECNSDDDDTSTGSSTSNELCIWSVGCIYDANVLQKKQVQSFVRNVVEAFRDFRYHYCMTNNRRTDCWRNHGSPNNAQEHEFVPVLASLMEDAAWCAKRAELQADVDTLKDIMAENIRRILERDEDLERLQTKAEELKSAAVVFKKRSTKLKKKMLWKRAKYGMVAGTALSAGVTAIVLPLVL